jgi:hypothetical protein
VVLRPVADQQETMKELRPWIQDQREEYDNWWHKMALFVQWDYVRSQGRIDVRGMGIFEGTLAGLEKEMEDW